MGDNIFPKRRNWHSGTNYIFLPSHFCICLEMQRRIAIVAIWNNCDRSVLSVLVVPVHQNRTHKLMHHAFKTWCIVSTSGRFSIKNSRFRQKTAVFLTFWRLQKLQALRLGFYLGFTPVVDSVFPTFWTKMIFEVKQHFGEKVPESCIQNGKALFLLYNSTEYSE